MDKNLAIFYGVLIPFIGTSLGAASVFFIKGEIKPKVQKALLGFASGVMIAASIWSLLMPAMEMSEQQGKPQWLAASVGFLAGMGFLLVLDMIIPHLHLNSDKPEGIRTKAEKSLMLILAVTLHNLPEGMAVGVVLGGMAAENSTISVAGALALAVGIAIQNLPEGAIVSAPLVGSGLTKGKAFGYGFLSGAVEPIGAIITILLTTLITPLLPYILSFAAGAMLYVVIEELIPESQSGDHSNIGTICTALGFTLMMVLDITLG